MSIKLKALGLGLIAALAMSAVAVMNASASGGGHFVTPGESHPTIEGHVNGVNHTLHLTNHGLSGEVGCSQQSYVTTTTSETSPDISVVPTYAGCTTTGTSTTVPVDVNGCSYKFTVAAGTTNNTEQTAHLVCPAGKTIQVTHPNCTVTIHPQTVNTGLTYTTDTSATGVHDITMHVNVQFNTTRHGFCQFIAPTNGTGTLKGAVTITAKNTAGVQVPITAT